MAVLRLSGSLRLRLAIVARPPCDSLSAPSSRSSSAAGQAASEAGVATARPQLTKVAGLAGGPVQELLEAGSIHPSPGGQYSYRVLGPCCRLFDREELPWPCCRLAWRSKEPSWRRVGRRFVADLAARRCPSYVVELLQPGARPTRTVITLFPQRLGPALQEWWYSKQPASLDPANSAPPAPLPAAPEPPLITSDSVPTPGAS
jgi:hypothetical protein